MSPGTRLGPYQIVSALGKGGMGEVYKATDTRLGRLVAIKVLPGHVASNPDLRARFDREAKALAALATRISAPFMTSVARTASTFW